MKRALLIVLPVVLFACGKADPVVPDAGVIDTSCGIDCAAQRRYGLLVNTCFEYSASSAAQDPADLGVLVRGVVTLENDVKALEVEYSESGQIRMTDYFNFKDGSLHHVRRSVAGGGRVQYQDDAGVMVGVPWVRPDTSNGQTFTTSLTASLLANDMVTTEPVSFKVSASTPDTATELTVPLKTYEGGITLRFDEMPDHGADRRRVLVQDTGFIAFTSAFSLNSSATFTTYRLQRIREVGAGADGGNISCGFGSP